MVSSVDCFMLILYYILFVTGLWLHDNYYYVYGHLYKNSKTLHLIIAKASYVKERDSKQIA